MVARSEQPARGLRLPVAALCRRLFGVLVLLVATSGACRAQPAPAAEGKCAVETAAAH
jgi:hypothetical protein